MAAAMQRSWATSEPLLMLIRTDRSAGQLSVLQDLQGQAADLGAWTFSADANVVGLDGPYETFLRALSTFAPRVATEPSSVGVAIRQRLAQAAGQNSKLLTDFCPAFSPILPSNVETETLSFGFARDRLETLLVRIFAPWSTVEPPYVFFLRHASRADAATLRILSRILAHAQIRQMIVVALVDVQDEPRDEQAWRSFTQGKKYVIERFDYDLKIPSGQETAPPSGRVPTLLTPDVRHAVEAAACCGQVTDAEQVAAALDISVDDVTKRLTLAVDVGILRRHGSVFTFVDPRAAQAYHGQMGSAERVQTHKRLAQFLVANRISATNPRGTFLAAAHLTKALRGTAISEADQGPIVETLLKAAQQAMNVSAHEVALEYLAPIVEMAPNRDIWTSAFAANAPQINMARLECACAMGDRIRATLLFEELRVRLDKGSEMAAARRWMVEMAARLGDHTRALDLAGEALAHYGIRIEASPTVEFVDKAIAGVWEALGERAIEEISDLEPMTHPDMTEASEMLFAVHPSAQTIGAPAADIVACNLARLTLEYGIANASSVGFAALGAAIIGRQKNHLTGTRFGKIALQLCEQRGTSLPHSAVAMKFAAAMSIWTHPLQHSIDQCSRTYEIALSCGDSRSATRLSAMVAFLTLLQGSALDEVSDEALRRRRAIRSHYCDDEGMGDLCDGIERFVGQQKGRTAQRRGKSGIWTDTSRLGHVALHVIDLMGLVLTHEYDAALFLSNNISKAIGLVGAQLLVAEYWFWTMLAATATKTSGLPHNFEQVLDDFERWADRCPQTFQHKFALLSAERARLEGRDLDAMRGYDQAIAEARDNGFTHLEAFAADMATRFYMTRDFPLIAGTYFRMARSAYERWGASAKVLQFDRRYPKLSGTDEQSPNTSPPSLRVPGEVDVFSAVKVAQSISKEIVQQRLLVALMKIVTEHIAAERCHVFLEGEGTELNHAGRAMTTSKGLDIEVPGPTGQSLEDCLPLRIIDHVRVTHESVCLDDAALDRTWADDPYISANRPRSIVCFPILRQSTIVGLLYLENNAARGMFTARRLALLEFLANQAAISLEHAKLYAEVARENTDRRRAEQVLRRSEERLRRLVETADVIPWEIDAETGIFTYVGAQAEKRLGWPFAAWNKPHFLKECVHPEDQQETLAAFTRTCSEGKHPGLDFRLLAMNGQAVWLHMVVGSVEQENGERVISGFFFDITERKESEQTLLDKLAIIERQKNDIRALSTPLLDVSEGIVAMPVLGELDEDRASRIMDVLLETITRRNVRGAILDLTGVSSINNATAEQIGRIVRAVELVGARAIVAGIRADVARAIVTLDVGLGQIETRASMKDALRVLVRPMSAPRMATKNQSGSSR